ncbi:MAG: alpha/beta hydrolase [Oscillospiraceae bacterium]|nr:alpha/beta hydrolase [Oscillospiraceae bacterium]
MLHETVQLTVPGADGPARLVSYVPNRYPEPGSHPRPALIVCPGGGYERLSDREGEPVALRFAGLGYAVFILYYHTAPQAHWPVPQRQLLAAIDHVRTNCGHYGIDPLAVIPMGFSAGGHLAGCAGTMWNRPEIYRSLKKKSPAFRPDGVILCYPVVTGGEHAHEESFRNLLGSRYDELAETVSLEKRVTKKSPPMFLWHTADDTSVPVENSLLLAKALKARGVDCELRVYPHGSHGQSLADRTVFAPDRMYQLSVPCSVWVHHCDAWLQRRFDGSQDSGSVSAEYKQ